MPNWHDEVFYDQHKNDPPDWPVRFGCAFFVVLFFGPPILAWWLL